MASRAEWAKRVERWERSGLGTAAFAAREGLKHKRLAWWRWKLRSSPPPSSPSALEFLPVRIVEPNRPAEVTASPLEVALPNGRVVRVTPGFDPGMLSRVLSIASEAEPC